MLQSLVTNELGSGHGLVWGTFLAFNSTSWREAWQPSARKLISKPRF